MDVVRASGNNTLNYNNEEPKSKNKANIKSIKTFSNNSSYNEEILRILESLEKPVKREIDDSNIIKKYKKTRCIEKNVNTQLTMSEINIQPVNIVYRVDTRDIDTIKESGGFFPYEGAPKARRTYGIMEHFNEDIGIIENEPKNVSNLISTTSNFSSLISIAEDILIKTSDNDGRIYDEEKVYLYEIRPNNNFYDAEASLKYRRNKAIFMNNDRETNALDYYIQTYGGLNEIVAFKCIDFDRVIRYAELNGELINNKSYKQHLINTGFGELPCIENDSYNSQFDNDFSSQEPYDAIILNVTDVPFLLSDVLPPSSDSGDFGTL